MTALISTDLQELPCYLSNVYETFPLLLQFIGEQNSANFFVKVIICCHGKPDFDAMFSQILTFLIFFLLIDYFFKIIANSFLKGKKSVFSLS